MKALVIGASGLIGEALMRTYPFVQTCIGTTYEQKIDDLLPLNISNIEAIHKTLKTVQPNVVILCAANPNVDYCEREPEITRITNVIGVQNVTEVCKFSDIKLIFFSSDYVFDGNNGPYLESAIPNPVCVYGQQKLEAEKIVLHSSSTKNLVLRVTGVFGEERRQKNFVYRVINTLKNNKALLVPNDQYGNPTLSDDLTNAVWMLIKKNTRGIFHLAGPTLMNRLEFTKLIAEVFHLSTEHIQGLTTKELSQDAPRPLRGGLISEQAIEILGRPMLNARESLEHLQKTKALNV
jgi:dTDP-4-dehydrorhamnose reductase